MEKVLVSADLMNRWLRITHFIDEIAQLSR
jgi:hypothetical protein